MSDEADHSSEDSAAAVERILELSELLKGAPLEDPYTTYARLRREAPVHEGNISATELGAATRPSERPTFSVLGYDQVVEVLKNPDVFSSRIYAESLGEAMGENLLMLDGIPHRRHRKILMPLLNRSRIRMWDRDVFRPLIQAEYLDQIVANGPRADLMRDLCVFFPVSFIYGLLGIPEEMRAEFHEQAVRILIGVVDPEGQMVASRRIDELLGPILEQRRATQELDLISEVLHGEAAQEPFDDAELMGFLKLLLPAGAETTTRGSANTLAMLLKHPDRLRELAEDRSLIPGAILEAIRLEPPVAAVFREAVVDTELAGTKIPKGSAVNVYVGAANRDEAHFEEPDRFDVRRSNSKQGLSFGFGSHLCMGMHIALTEIDSVLNMIFDQMPNLRADPDEPPATVTGVNFRSPRTIPVVFDC